MSISPCCGGHVDRSSSSGQTTEAESCSRVHRGRVVSTWYRGRGRLLPRRREHIAIERALEIGTPTSDYTPPQGIELTVYTSCVRARQSVLELKKRFRGYSLTLPLGTAVTYKVRVIGQLDSLNDRSLSTFHSITIVRRTCYCAGLLRFYLLQLR